MKGWAVVLIGVLSVFAVSCNDIGDGGGGGGGPGGGFAFNHGYVYVNPDDQNVYIVDDSNLSAPQVLSRTGDAMQPSISRDGKSVVFIFGTNAGAPAIQTVPTSAAASPTTVLASSSSVLNLRNPVFSPDGTAIVFVYDDASGLSHVGLVGSNGQGFTTLSTGNGDYVSPSFGPDGSLFVGFGSSAGAVSEIDQIDISSGAQTQLLATLGNTAMSIVDRMAISPDGTRAVFAARVSSGATRIFVADLSTKNVVQLSDHPGEPGAEDSYPTWVGVTQLAFASNAGGARGVYLAAATDTVTAGTLTLPSGLMPWYGP